MKPSDVSALTAKAVVKRGAKMLDKKLPGWEKKVAITTLRMDDGCKCVLGQLGGKYVNLDRLGWERDGSPDYDEMLVLLGIARYEPATKHGFDVNFDIGTSYADLQKAWIEEIRDRRSA